MARPKRKTSHRRKGLRSAHDGLRAANAIPCPNCQEWTMPHQVCPSCGQYKGKEIIAQETEE